MKDYFLISSTAPAIALGEHKPNRPPLKGGRLFTGDSTPTPAERTALFAPTHTDELNALRGKCADYSQRRLDAFAAGLGYDNVTTLRAAALSAIPRFHSEGVAGQAAWDAEWSAAQAFIVAVQTGQVAPTFDNYKAAMPATFTLPTL